MLKVREMAEIIRARIAADESLPCALRAGRDAFAEQLASCATCAELGTICPDCRAKRYRENARPTQSPVLYMQQFGRVLRPRPSRLVRAQMWLFTYPRVRFDVWREAWWAYGREMRLSLYVGVALGAAWFLLFDWLWS
jgi:hypothetical protein